MILTINEPIHVTRHAATAINCVFKYTIMENIEIKTAVVKTDILHIIIFATKNNMNAEILGQNIFKCNISDKSINKFRQKLHDID